MFPITLVETKAKRKALIIDDETDICYLLSSLLRQKGVQSTFAGTLYEADRLYEQGSPPDIIFLDNQLPDGIGTGYISKLKKRFPAAKIVMITAHDNLKDREKARAEGADHFISKPFPRDFILKTIDNLLGN